jgi:hypothetical protein
MPTEDTEGWCHGGRRQQGGAGDGEQYPSVTSYTGSGGKYSVQEEAECISQEFGPSLFAQLHFCTEELTYPEELRGLSGMTPLDRAATTPTSPYVGADADPYSDPSADVSFSQSALQQSATLTSNDAAIMQREREITDIARGILELADIFKELQTMVIDQGTLLDRIDFNIERLNVHVKEASKEMTVV